MSPVCAMSFPLPAAVATCDVPSAPVVLTRRATLLDFPLCMRVEHHQPPCCLPIHGRRSPDLAPWCRARAAGWSSASSLSTGFTRTELCGLAFSVLVVAVISPELPCAVHQAVVAGLHLVVFARRRSASHAGENRCSRSVVSSYGVFSSLLNMFMCVCLRRCDIREVWMKEKVEINATPLGVR